MKKIFLLFAILLLAVLPAGQAHSFGRGDRPPAKSLKEAMDSGVVDDSSVSSCMASAMRGSRKGDGDPDLTIESARAEFIEGALSVEFKVKGKVTPGTIDPPDVNMYVMEVVPSSGGKPDLAAQCVEWMFIPSSIGQDRLNRIEEEHDPKVKAMREKTKETGMIAMTIVLDQGQPAGSDIFLDADFESSVDGNSFKGKLTAPGLEPPATGSLYVRVYALKNHSVDDMAPIMHDSRIVRVKN